MTHLETMIRSLPRQRRAFDTQKSYGLGMFMTGFIIAAVIVTLMSTSLGARFGGLFVMLLILAAYLMLFGGWRYTYADIMIARIDAELEAVMEAFGELEDARQEAVIRRSPENVQAHIDSTIRANTAAMVAAIAAAQRPVDPASATVRHGR